jgi:hypothetical protein
MSTHNMVERPEYIALDSQGIEYTRKAIAIHELPTVEERLNASVEAAVEVSRQLGLPCPKQIKLGVPVFQSFGMTRPQAKNHLQSKLLLTPGSDLSLDLCISYQY